MSAPAEFSVYVGDVLWSDGVTESEVEQYVRSAGAGTAEERFGHYLDPASDEVQATAPEGGLVGEWEVVVEPMERGRVESVVVRVERVGGGL